MDSLFNCLEQKLHRFRDPITISDPATPDMSILMANGPFLRLSGYSPKDFPMASLEAFRNTSRGQIHSLIEPLHIPGRTAPLMVGLHCAAARYSDKPAWALHREALLDVRRRSQHVMRAALENRWISVQTILKTEIARYERASESIARNTYIPDPTRLRPLPVDHSAAVFAA